MPVSQRLRAAKKFELRHNREWHMNGLQRFASLFNLIRRRVPDELRGFVDVTHSIGFETHEPGTRRICGYRIVGENNTAQLPGRPIQWAVALHAPNGIRDYEMDGNRGTQVKDRFLDAVPMENVLRPPVLVPGNHP